MHSLDLGLVRTIICTVFLAPLESVTNTRNRQMSTLLSRPLLIDQDDHQLQTPDGRLENMPDPEAPHPLSAVTLQAELGLCVSHLFQKLGSDSSVKLTLEIEDALEKWMGTFPAALRDHRPDTRWDQKYANIPFMRCQLNVVAYCYLLAPLKPYLLGTADKEIMNTQLGKDLRVKGVDTCLDLINASEKFYDLIFPTSIKYFFIIFFMFDAATVVCSAIVHDTDHTLPKRSQCIRALRTAQELIGDVAHLSETARISFQLLRKLTATLPLTASEKQVLGIVLDVPSNKKARVESNAYAVGNVAAAGGDGAQYDYISANQKSAAGYGGSSAAVPDMANPMNDTSLLSTHANSATGVGSKATLYDLPPQQHQQHPPPSYDIATAEQAMYYSLHTGASNMVMPPVSNGAAIPVQQQWPVLDYHSVSMAEELLPQQSIMGDGMQMGNMQRGDPLTGTFLEPLWSWDHLNMDFSGHNMPPYGF